jgi:hypothetical protein
LDQNRRITPVDLFSFGNSKTPREPRRGKDMEIDSSDMVVPQGGSSPLGASTFADPDCAQLSGHYFRLPAGTELPEGLEFVADGRDVIPESIHQPTHHTIYSAVAMSYRRFVELFLSLPWIHEGKK